MTLTTSTQAPATTGTGQVIEPMSAGLPGCTVTVVITALFGVFGIIPAHLHAKRAERAGASGRVYWEAFGTTFAVLVVLSTVFVFAVVRSLVASLP